MSATTSVPLREARGVNARVLDETTRERRQKKVLEALEMDNLHEEPHADLVMSKKAPKFQETLEATRSKPGPSKKRKLRGTEYYKKYSKTFQQLLEEDWTRPNEKGPTYSTIEAPPPKRPPRKLCNVCGFPCGYTCIQCGVSFCSVKCNTTHRETRCLKWIA
jgi:zinc finger HIT domain-containing protein 1